MRVHFVGGISDFCFVIIDALSILDSFYFHREQSMVFFVILTAGTYLLGGSRGGWDEAEEAKKKEEQRKKAELLDDCRAEQRKRLEEHKEHQKKAKLAYAEAAPTGPGYQRLEELEKTTRNREEFREKQKKEKLIEEKQEKKFRKWSKSRLIEEAIGRERDFRRSREKKKQIEFEKAKQFEIFIEVGRGNAITLDVKASDTVNQLKAKMQAKLGFGGQSNLVVCLGQPWMGRTLADYGLQERSVVTLVRDFTTNTPTEMPFLADHISGGDDHHVWGLSGSRYEFHERDGP
jgi:hypothetical protein